MPIVPPADLQPPLYEDVRAFDARDGETRIFAPISYSRVRQTQLVPIVHIEALSLAHWFPVCWLMANGAATLVTLRTLRADGSGQPSGSPASTASLPLALRAYPFVVGAADGVDEQDEHFLEAAIPDQPSDIGAPIMTPAGKAAPGARMKLQALAAFNHALPLSRAMTESLVRSDLLEPWPLQFDIDGEQVAVDDLYVVNAGELASARMFQFIETFGSVAATLLGAHRISLFRAGVLVQAAKGAAAAARAQ